MIVENLNIKIDQLSAHSYFNDLQFYHKNTAWNYKDDDPYIPENSNYRDMIGWGILDSTVEPIRTGSGYFGFGKTIVDFFSIPLRACVAVIVPGSHLSLHEDNGVKIHIPLTYNKESFFFGNDYVYHPTSIGNVYLLHTNHPHGMKYDGENNRAHIIISCDEKYLDIIYSKKGMTCV